MRWRLYIEEYSPDLHYIKGTNNVVADALSRLDMDDAPPEDTQETFLGLMECFATAEPSDIHPLNYQHLRIAQEADKTLMKLSKMKDTLYLKHEFHGGGKVTPLLCYKGKIVIPVLAPLLAPDTKASKTVVFASANFFSFIKEKIKVKAIMATKINAERLEVK